MAARIVQIGFKFNISPSDYEQITSSVVEAFAAVPGLRWKIWIVNEAECEAGGIYLFEDAASAQAFLAGPLAAQTLSHPALSDFSVKQFNVMESATIVTRGPVQ